MTEFTTNLHFSLVDFNVATWHDEVNDNFRSLDALIAAFTGITGLLGPWKNSTVYSVGQRVIDTDLNSLWQVAIAHTSAAAGTFAAYRAANPTHWTLISPAIPNPYNVLGNFSVGGNSVLSGTLAAGTTTINGQLTTTGNHLYNDGTIQFLAPGIFAGVVYVGTISNHSWNLLVNNGIIGTVSLTGLNALPIGQTTPRAGAFTTLSSTGVTNLKGEAAAGNAAAGDIGEVIQAEVLTGAAVALVTATPKTVTSIALTAGDWDVYGSVAFLPAATTSITNLFQSLSLVTNAVDVTPSRISADVFAAIVPAADVRKTLSTMATRFSLAAPATIFLVAQATFTVAALSGYGRIWARRAR